MTNLQCDFLLAKLILTSVNSDTSPVGITFKLAHGDMKRHPGFASLWVSRKEKKNTQLPSSLISANESACFAYFKACSQFQTWPYFQYITHFFLRRTSRLLVQQAKMSHDRWLTADKLASEGFVTYLGSQFPLKYWFFSQRMSLSWWWSSLSVFLRFALRYENYHRKTDFGIYRTHFPIKLISAGLNGEGSGGWEMGKIRGMGDSKEMRNTE